MQILSTTQIKEADKQTLQAQKITSLALMERAANACFDRIMKAPAPEKGYAVFCGPGNNGGDGLVIARLLKKAGADVMAFLIPSDARSRENSANLERLREAGIDIREINVTEIPEKILSGKTLIDALLGSGLNRPVEGIYKELIQKINESKKNCHQIIAIDCPSGFYTDEPLPEKARAIRADLTLCFGSPRLMYFFPESFPFCGNWEVIDIGLEPVKPIFPGYHYTLINDLKHLMPLRPLFSHKGHYGHALMAGGSSGKCGAMILAAKACLRSGSGLTTALIPEICQNPLQTAVPEAMTIAGSESHYLASDLHFDTFDAIGFGPGATTHPQTAVLLKRMIQEAGVPMIIDADGLNILSENKTWLAFLPNNTILTPHPGEFDRLSGKSVSGYERLMKAKEMAMRFQCIIVLKGAFTAVVLPDGSVHFNSTGNPGMATAGSGDVLSGIITALLAQGIPAEDTTRIAVFIHGLAGDIAAEKYGVTSLIAGDIIEFLPDAFKILTT